MSRSLSSSQKQCIRWGFRCPWDWVDMAIFSHTVPTSILIVRLVRRSGVSVIFPLKICLPLSCEWLVCCVCVWHQWYRRRCSRHMIRASRPSCWQCSVRCSWLIMPLLRHLHLRAQWWHTTCRHRCLQYVTTERWLPSRKKSRHGELTAVACPCSSVHISSVIHLMWSGWLGVTSFRPSNTHTRTHSTV